MEVKLQPGQQLNKDQKEVMLKGFDYIASHCEGARARKRQGLPMVLLPQDAPRMLRACGRGLLPEDVEDIMRDLPDEGLDFNDFCKLFERVAQTPQANEAKICQALNALDITGQGMIDPKFLKDIIRGQGEGMMGGMTPFDIDTVLKGLPRDRLGKITARAIARRLVRGPDGVQYLS